MISQSGIVDARSICEWTVGVVVKTSLLAQEVFGAIPDRTVSPKARHRCDVSVLPRRFAAEMDLASRYTLRRNTASVMGI